MANHAMLLVEGESDQKFFATLLKEMALDVQVQPETPKSISDGIFRNGINPLAELSTWLAWQHKPGIDPAYAYCKTLFDKEHPHLLALKTWLTTVFA